MVEDILAAVAASPVALALKESRVAYPVVNALHILGLASLFGAILALDLRLLGLFQGTSATALARTLPNVAASGLLVASTTGLLLFSVAPQDYAANPAFRLKLLLVLAGTAHALVLRRSRAWRSLASGEGPVTGGLRLSAALSLTIWTAAIFAGRFIAFQ